MSRYIDMDELLKRFEELHKNENNLLNCYNADWIVQFIEGQTIADVQEVKYGEWVPDDEQVVGGALTVGTLQTKNFLSGIELLTKMVGIYVINQQIRSIVLGVVPKWKCQ